MPVVSFIVGLVMGFVSKQVTKILIINRNGDIKGSKILDGTYSSLFWGLSSAVGYVVITALFFGNTLRMIECVLVFSVCLIIPAVDFEIKKIPNELLLSLLLLKIVMLVLSKGNFSDAIFGMLFAATVFLAPTKIGKTIGAGDIKLAMIVGFFVGPVGFIQTIAIMGLSLSIYLAYLMVTRKGGLKTSTALGPYISLGFIITLCVSIPINI